MARLYDKLLEIVTVSKKDYLFPLWEQAGWDGSQHVWRLEFQVKQEAIKQFGLTEFDLVLDNLGGIWGYLTTEWLRLSIPNPSDSTRSRWDIHPIWTLLASVDWEEKGGELTRAFPVLRSPGNDWLMTNSLSALTSFMAVNGIYDFEEGIDALKAHLFVYHDEKAFLYGQSFSSYIWDKVACKVRQYNARMNVDQVSEEVRHAKGLDVVSETYRKASDGE